MDKDIESIYREFDAKLKGFIFKRVSDAAAAEDILQDVYMRIHDRVDTLRDDTRLQSWIYQIARNGIIDYYRRKRPQVELDERLALPEEEPEDAQAELAGSVQAMLECLPDKDREALALADLQGLPQREIADRLGITLSGAKSRIQRAREKLKEAFLNCCHLEFDRLGTIVDYQPRCGECARDQCDTGNGL